MDDLETGVDSVPSLAPEANKMAANQVGFAARYFSRNSAKNLTASEAARLGTAGIKIVSVWEAAGNRVESFDMLSGARDGAAARALGIYCGQPRGSAIYFAVDFDATAAQITGAVEPYFRGVGMALKEMFDVGVYGSGLAISMLKAAGLAKYGWLGGAMGWAGSRGFDGWDIKQGLPSDPYAFGFDIDPDQARGDFGAWTCPVRSTPAAGAQGAPSPIQSAPNPVQSAPADASQAEADVLMQAELKGES